MVVRSDSPGPDIDQLITPSPIILGLLNNDRHSTREDVSVSPDVIDEKQPLVQIDVFDSGLDSSIIPTITNSRDTQQTSHTVSETKNEVKSSSPSGFFSRLKSKPKANDDQYNNPDNNLIESTNCFQCIIL